MGEGATCAWARRTAARPSASDSCGAKRSTEVSLAPKGCAAPSAAPWAADAEACSRAPPAKGCGSYGDKPGGHAQLRGPCTHTDTHTHARKHARARRHAHTQIHTRTCTHTHARTLARAQKHTHTHRHTGTHRQTHTHARLLIRPWARGARRSRPPAPPQRRATGRTGSAAWARTRGSCGRRPSTSAI